jgi:hypothetical protein
MSVIPWGEWRPDVSDYNGQHTQRAENVVPRGDGFGPVPNLSEFTDALPAACRGAFRGEASDGSIAVFAGTSEHLYKLNNTTLEWETVSKNATELGNDSYTKVLLHMDGSDTSTTFTDDNAGGSAHTWTAAGNAQLDTADKKFGTASGLFDGTGDYITTPDHSDFTLGSGDWTIDFWFKADDAGGTAKALGGQRSAAGTATTISWEIYKTAANVIQLDVVQSSTLTSVTGTTTFTSALNTGWHHVAAVRTGDILKLFIDGVQEGSSTAFTGSVNDSSEVLGVGVIGAFTALSQWDGWIDEFRLSVGIARWTAAFTPPTGSYNATGPYAVPAAGQWQFAQLGSVVVAVNGADSNQAYTLGSSTDFADLAGSPPVAAYITVVNEFIVLAGLLSNPFRIAWSARSSAVGWTAGTDESDVQDFTDGGIVKGVAGGEFGIVLQDNAIRNMIYQPGSAVIFSFDRVCEGKGLRHPYSLVRAGERIFFRSASGFETMVPGGQPTPVGKERFDRFFDEDYDTGSPQLFIGAYEPDSSRIYWAYKSETGTAGLFNRILIWDFVLERGALITGVSGEYIAALATPGVTLEGLDALYATLEDITVSLDDIPASVVVNLSIFSSSHKAGFLSGDNLEAIIETAEVGSDRRQMVRSVRPDTDAGTVYSSVLTRARLTDTATTSAEVTMDTYGFAFHRADARLIKYRNRIPAATQWTFSIGVEPDSVVTGMR